MDCFESIVVFIIDGGTEVDINMASINVKKHEPGKHNKRCLTLDEKVKILDEVKKRKLSCRVIAKEFKIAETQAANVIKNERTLREEFAKFQGKKFKHINRRQKQSSGGVLQKSFIKKETLEQVLSCEFCEISKSTFFYRTPPVAASGGKSPKIQSN